MPNGTLVIITIIYRFDTFSGGRALGDVRQDQLGASSSELGSSIQKCDTI